MISEVSTDRSSSPLRPGPARPFDDDVEQVLTDLGTASARLPRRQAGRAPQNLLVTLMADFTLSTRAWVPSAALVALLTQFSVSGSNARTAISRLARRRVLEARKQGRNTFYRLSGPSASTLAVAGRGLAGHPTDAETWDGQWSLVTFSLPHDQGAQRRALRGQLRWLGFAPLYDGLWIRPAPLVRDDAVSLTGIAPNCVSMFRGPHLSFSLPTGRTPLDAWDLTAIAARYRSFVDTWADRPTPGSGVEALLTRTAVIEEYRLLPLLDPPLPLKDMPPDWPRQSAHDVLKAVYDGLAKPALGHVRDVISDVTGLAPVGIRTHTVAQMAAGLHPAP